MAKGSRRSSKRKREDDISATLDHYEPDEFLELEMANPFPQPEICPDAMAEHLPHDQHHPDDADGGGFGLFGDDRDYEDLYSGLAGLAIDEDGDDDDVRNLRPHGWKDLLITLQIKYFKRALAKAKKSMERCEDCKSSYY